MCGRRLQPAFLQNGNFFPVAVFYTLGVGVRLPSGRALLYGSGQGTP